MSKHERFGSIIRSMRKNAGLSMKELCSGICAESTMSRIENGVHFPHEEIVDKLAGRLGEQDFYERYILGNKYESLKKRESVKQTLLAAAAFGEVGDIEEHLIELKSLLGESSKEDMQFYLALQNIWYEMNGVSVADRTKRLIEIFEMTKVFPKEDESIREVADKMTLNDTEHILVNNIGISLMKDGRAKLGLKVLSGLFTIIHEKMPESANKARKLAIVSNNCCVACLQCDLDEEARVFCKYAKKYSFKLKDLDLICSSILIEAKILEKDGKQKEAENKRRFVSEMQKFLANEANIKSDVIYRKYSGEGIVVL